LIQSDFDDSSYSPLLQGAIRQQHNIGFNVMLRGYLAEGWYTALQTSGFWMQPSRYKTVCIAKYGVVRGI
jgi:hypothetical protein